MAAYPKRPKFFANRFTRLVFKTCLAQEIGPSAVMLLVAVVHTEDAAHYRRPVTFFNDQLIPLIGVGGWAALDRARQKAVDAGWLNYEAGGKGKAGKYFVTIPKHADGLDDLPTDEGFHLQYGGASDDEAPVSTSKNEEEKPAFAPPQMEGKTADLHLRKRRGSGGANGGEAEVQTVIIPKALNLSLTKPPPEACPEPPKGDSGPTEIVMTFPCSGKGSPTWGLPAFKVAEYQDSYPWVDVLLECRKARQWCIDNATNRKTVEGMPRFLNRWLAKAQNEGGSYAKTRHAGAVGHQGREQERLERNADALSRFVAAHPDVGEGLRESDCGPGRPQALGGPDGAAG